MALIERFQDAQWMISEIERLRAQAVRAGAPCARCGATDRSIDATWHCATCYVEAVAANERLTRERDEARAEVDRLREIMAASLRVDCWRCPGCEAAKAEPCDMMTGARDSALARAEAAEKEVERLREQSESWRRAHVAWQQWAAGLLRELSLQPEMGYLGDAPAREAIAATVRRLAE